MNPIWDIGRGDAALRLENLMLPFNLSNAITYLSNTNMLWLRNVSLPGLFVLRGCLLIMNLCFCPLHGVHAPV